MNEWKKVPTYTVISTYTIIQLVRVDCHKFYNNNDWSDAKFFEYKESTTE